MEKTFLTFELLLSVVAAYQAGAPDSGCIDMIPHCQLNTNADTSQSPFVIQGPSTYHPGDIIEVTVNRRNGTNIPLKGILLQARNGSFLHQNYILGNFLSIEAHGLKGKTCLTLSTEDKESLPNSITHRDNSEKSLPFKFQWITYHNVGPIMFVATFLSQKSTFWIFVTSNTININLDTSTVNPVDCHGKLCNNGTCVGTWEKCPEDACPKTGDYRCLDGACGNYRCNGVPECQKGEDEKCCNSFGQQYQCLADRRCISGNQVCDHFGDCHGGDDERNCATSLTVRPCASDQFDCGNGECILNSWRCNGTPDCTNGNDERCSTTTSEPSNVNSGAVIYGIVGGVIPLVVLIIIAIVIIIIIRRKNSVKRNADEDRNGPVVTGSLSQAQPYQTSALQPGVYPNRAAYDNHAFSSPSQLHATSSPVPPYSKSGVSNPTYTSELPPSYDQATGYNNHYEEIPESKMGASSKYNGSQYHDSETLQNLQNARYENAMASTSMGVDNDAYYVKLDKKSTNSGNANSYTMPTQSTKFPLETTI